MAHQSPSSESFSANADQKRKRKTFSCYNCRRKKLKCDRVYPACGRCQEFGCASSCVYDSKPPLMSEYSASRSTAEGPEEAAYKRQKSTSSHQSVGGDRQYHHSFLEEDGSLLASKLGAEDIMNKADKPLVNDLIALLQRQAARIAILEDSIGRRESKQVWMGKQERFHSPTPLSILHYATAGVDPHLTGAELANSLDEEAMLFRGKGFDTQYYGASNPLSVVSTSPAILKNYPGLKVFMQDPTIHSQSLQRVQTIAKDLKEKHKKLKKRVALKPVHLLSELLQDKGEMAQLVQLYWSVIENSYRILHGPTFWAKYRSLCEQPSNASESFTVVLLLVMASARCIYPRQSTSYRGLSSVDRDEAMTSIAVCEDWVSRQSRKHVSIEFVQIRVLLFLAKQANSVHVKRSWEEAASLLNFSLGIGLHRDPKLLEKVVGACVAGPNQRINEHEKEMRRRLWATIIELELQAAFDRGLPSCLNSPTANSVIPSNINDEDLAEGVTHLPPSKSHESYTSSSFLFISSRSFALRSAMNRIINDPNICISYDDLLHYHNQTTEELESMPSWVETHRRNDTASPSSAIPALLLDIQLRQYLLMLHLPFAQRADINSRYSYSRMVCLNAANTILEYHYKLTASGNSYLNFLRQDVFRSSLAMCHSIISWKSIQNDLFVQNLTQLFSQQIEKGLVLLEGKILRLGGQFKYISFLCAAYGMFRSASAQDEIHIHLQDIVDRLTRLFCRVVDGQQQLGTNVVAVVKGNIPSGRVATVNEVPLQNPSLQYPSLQYISPEETEIASWDRAESWNWNNDELNWYT